MPAKYKGEPWARLGVDVDNQFAPLYIVTPEKKGKVAELKRCPEDRRRALLATDHDREGEAIAWHLLETLKPKVPVRRMVFHEITEPAIRAAVENLRDLDHDLVDAQETRRILDRLYGYEVSPVLWKKVMPKLSAGRVQSVATRIIVQRERERMAFVSGLVLGHRRRSWTPAPTPTPAAVRRPGWSRSTATGWPPAATSARTGGSRRGADALRWTRRAPAGWPRRCEGRDLTVESVESKPYTRKPYAAVHDLDAAAGGRPQAAASPPTARCAARSGSTRTATSPTCAPTPPRCPSRPSRRPARRPASSTATRTCRPQPRQYTRKVKNAQEAHEAIRPAGETFRTPGQIAREVDGDDFRLYELIWQRTVASQMADARGHHGQRADRRHRRPPARRCTFAASGRTITFPGFLGPTSRPSTTEAGGEADDAESRLPELTEGQPLTAAS